MSTIPNRALGALAGLLALGLGLAWPGCGSEGEATGPAGGYLPAGGVGGTGGAAQAGGGVGGGTGGGGAATGGIGGATGGAGGSPCVPEDEVCDGLDNDCDEDIDEGCLCTHGDEQSCYTGSPALAGVGECHYGVQVCDLSGAWGACTGDGLPSDEQCDGLDNDCDGATDEGCGTCNNMSAQATPSSSGGGAGSYGPAALKDGIVGSCGAFCWISNSQTPSGAYYQYTWSSPVTIGSFYVDGEHATSPLCGTTGRDIKYAEVQWWNGTSWVTAGTLQNQENYMFSFPSPVTTDRIRLYNVYTSPGNGNSIVFEWYVYSASVCPVP